MLFSMKLLLPLMTHKKQLYFIKNGQRWRGGGVGVAHKITKIPEKKALPSFSVNIFSVYV